jgi:hypothetical protein
MWRIKSSAIPEGASGLMLGYLVTNGDDPSRGLVAFAITPGGWDDERAFGYANAIADDPGGNWAHIPLSQPNAENESWVVDLTAGPIPSYLYGAHAWRLDDETGRQAQRHPVTTWPWDAALVERLVDALSDDEAGHLETLLGAREESARLGLRK